MIFSIRFPGANRGCCSCSCRSSALCTVSGWVWASGAWCARSAGYTCTTTAGNVLPVWPLLTCTCRERIANNCGVNVNQLATAYEALLERQALLKAKAEEEAKVNLNEAKKKYDEVKRGEKKERPSLDDFELLKTLGRGAFGKVVLARYKGGNLYALKTVKKNEVMENEDDIAITMTERNVLSLGSQCRFITKVK